MRPNLTPDTQTMFNACLSLLGLTCPGCSSFPNLHTDQETGLDTTAASLPVSDTVKIQSLLMEDAAQEDVMQTLLTAQAACTLQVGCDSVNHVQV